MAAYNVLLVDDQKDITRMLQFALEQIEGVSFKFADVLSGEEALLETRLKKFDLVITDYRLPGINGLELISRLRERNPEMKIIIITGVSEPRLRRDVANAGADAFFFKPLEIYDFVDTVSKIFGMKEVLPIPTPEPVEAEEVEEIVEEEEPEIGVSERLTMLRNEINAVSTALFSDIGQLLVQSGDFPMPQAEETLAPALISMMSVSQRVSHFIGMQIPDSLFVFHGLVYSLIASHVAKSHALLVIVDSSSDHQLEAFVPPIREAVKDLLGILASMGVEVEDEAVELPSKEISETAVEEEVVEEVAAIDDKLDALLSQGIEEISEETSDLDSFWDVDEETDTEEITGIFDSGVLTYEQALQLGLAPDED